MLAKVKQSYEELRTGEIVEIKAERGNQSSVVVADGHMLSIPSKFLEPMPISKRELSQEKVKLKTYMNNLKSVMNTMKRQKLTALDAELHKELLR